MSKYLGIITYRTHSAEKGPHIERSITTAFHSSVSGCLAGVIGIHDIHSADDTIFIAYPPPVAKRFEVMKRLSLEDAEALAPLLALNVNNKPLLDHDGRYRIEVPCVYIMRSSQLSAREKALGITSGSHEAISGLADHMIHMHVDYDELVILEFPDDVVVDTALALLGISPTT